MSFFREPDNAAIFKKIINDDQKLESLNDKRVQCLLIQNGYLSLLDTLHSKTLTLQNLPLLETVLEFSYGIAQLITNFIRDYSKTKLFPRHCFGQFYPLIVQSRQMDIHHILSDMIGMLSDMKRKNFFKEYNKVFILNNFLCTLHPGLLYIQKFIVANEHFHMPILLQSCRINTKRSEWHY